MIHVAGTSNIADILMKLFTCVVILWNEDIYYYTLCLSIRSSFPFLS